MSSNREYIESYLRMLVDAHELGLPYLEKNSDVLDGASPASLSDLVLGLITEDVRNGHMTQAEADEIQLTRMPY